MEEIGETRPAALVVGADDVVGDMASEQAKSPTEQPAQPAPVAAYPPPYHGAAYSGPPYNGAHFAPLPPGTYPPPYYAYAPIPDPNHDPNAPNGAPPAVPYLMAFAPPPPPGMVYAYAPPLQQGQGMSAEQNECISALQLVPAVPYSYPPPPQAQATPPGPPAPRPKRKQVKMAVGSVVVALCSLALIVDFLPSI